MEQQHCQDANIHAILTRIGREFTATLDTAELLNHICSLTAQALACDYASLSVRYPIESAFLFSASYGESHEQQETRRVLTILGMNTAGLMSRFQGQQIVEVQVDDPEELLSRELLQQFGITAALYLPLYRGREIIGILEAGYHGKKGFSREQHCLAQGIAPLAALALTNALMNEENDRANRAKADFLATVSHELRTPLHLIMGYTTLLLEEVYGPLVIEQMQPIQQINASARTLFSMVNALLDASDLKAGRTDLNVQSIVVKEFIHHLQQHIGRTYRQQPGVCVLWYLEPDLPALHTDPLKLKVVLINLIANALKFTSAGTVMIAVAQQNTGFSFSVQDTGIGIAPHVTTSMFDLFQQGDGSATRQYEGLGLGLYIVKRLVQILGGTVTVESRENEGSTFCVWIPQLPLSGFPRLRE